jgi:hypothetical protein
MRCGQEEQMKSLVWELLVEMIVEEMIVEEMDWKDEVLVVQP